LEEARWVLTYNGSPSGYYCEEHAKYVMLNDGVGRWFRVEDYREKSIKEILLSEGGEATLERVAYLSGKTVQEILRIAIIDGNIKIVRRKYNLSQEYYTTYLTLEDGD
jgi:hypothetical protein